jgi:hypothetical protein
VDPVAVCADAVAAWHAAWLKSLGVESERSDGVWRALERPPVIYFAAMTLAPEAHIANALGSVCDSWQRLDLTAEGFRVWRKEPWFYRDAGPLAPEPTPPELEIVSVSTPEEVEEFEAVSVRGFGGENDVVEPGTYHPPSILADLAMAMFIGRVDGEAVAAAMGYPTEHAVGVFGVTTVESARRRGYGTAVTRAAMQTEMGKPSILAPSDEAESMYRRLGYRQVGELAIWSSKGP